MTEDAMLSRIAGASRRRRKVSLRWIEERRHCERLMYDCAEVAEEYEALTNLHEEEAGGRREIPHVGTAGMPFPMRMGNGALACNRLWWSRSRDGTRRHER